MSERVVSFVAAPGCLNFDGGEDRAVRSLKHHFRIVHSVQDSLQVNHTREQVILGVLIEF